MGSWVENNFDRLCDKKCVRPPLVSVCAKQTYHITFKWLSTLCRCSNLMAEKIDVAVGNPNCTETSNSTVVTSLTLAML